MDQEPININELLPSMMVMMVFIMMFKAMASVFKEPEPKSLYPGGPPYGKFLRQP